MLIWKCFLKYLSYIRNTLDLANHMMMPVILAMITKTIPSNQITCTPGNIQYYHPGSISIQADQLASAAFH